MICNLVLSFVECSPRDTVKAMVSQETVSKFLVDFHRVNVDVCWCTQCTHLGNLIYSSMMLNFSSSVHSLFFLSPTTTAYSSYSPFSVAMTDPFHAQSVVVPRGFSALNSSPAGTLPKSPKVTAKDPDFQRLENLQCWISWAFWGICDGWTDFFCVSQSSLLEFLIAMWLWTNHGIIVQPRGNLVHWLGNPWNILEALQSLLGISPCFRGFIEMTLTLYHVVSLFQHTWFHGLKTTPDEASPEEHLVGFEPWTLIFGNGWTKHQELLGVLGTVFLVPYKVSIVTSH